MINGILTSIGVGLQGESNPSYSTEYQAVLDRATFLGYSLPSTAQQVKDNNAIVSMKSAGIWTLLDLFYGMTGNIDFATLNWKSPSQYQLTLVNSPSYTTTNGFLGNGTTSYLSTSWQPNIGVNFTQNEAGVGGYNTNNINDTSMLFGVSSATNSSSVYIQPRTTNLIAARINQGVTTSVANADSIGTYHIRRTSSTAIVVYKNGTSVISSSVTSQPRTSATMLLLARDAGGTVANFSLRSIRNFWLGGSLTGLESNMETIIRSIYA